MSLTPESVQSDHDLGQKSSQSAPVRESAPEISALHGGFLSALGGDPSSNSKSRILTHPVMHHPTGGEVRVLALRRAQQGLGNHKTQQMVAHLQRSPYIQRQCACGGTCESCQEKGVEEGTESQAVQRQATADAAGGMADANVIPADSPGYPLDHGTRSFMESRFGADFSDVRVHTDNRAAESARALSANAYTTGRDIYFATNKYAPASREGQHLLAHELTHTLQQENASMPLTSPAGGLRVSDAADPSEAEAERTAVAFSASSQPTVDKQVPKPRLSLARSTKILRQEAAPPTVATRVERQITVATSIRSEPVIVAVDLDDTTAPAFDADPTTSTRLANSLGALFNPSEGPLPETARFLSGTRVKALVEKDLPAWLGGNGLPALADVLSARAAAIRKQRVRIALEAWLGVPAGSIDWNMQIPQLRSDLPGLIGNTVEQASQLDRVEMFLHILEAEVAGSPPVDGGKPPVNLAELVFKYATGVIQHDNEIVGLFGEKFLGRYLDATALIRFVPDSFDLSRFAPSGADIAEARRNQLVDDFVKNEAPDLATQFILDRWTVSGETPESFVSGLDIDKEETTLIDYLVDRFFQRARQDPELAGTVREIAADLARYRLLASIVQFARNIEQRNRDLATLGDKDAFTLSKEERAIVDDPAGYYQTCWYLANATTTILNSVTSGANVAVESVENAAKIAGAADIPKNFGGIVLLVSLFTSIAVLKRTVDEQLARARERIASRMRLSWKQISDVISGRAKVADDYIEKVWIPKLKEVALKRIQANYDDLKKWLDNFGTETPNVIGRYKLAAFALEEVANKLDHGEAESVELHGQILEKKDVKQVRIAIEYLRAKAQKLETQEGQDEKKKELQKAVDAFADVKAGIESGKYKPLHFGPSVYEEARQELGIRGFEPGTTLGASITRRAIAGSNPFQNWAIARWQYTELVYENSKALTFFAGVFALTIASFLLPGVTHAILGALGVGFGVASAAAAGVGVAIVTADIGVNVYQGVRGIQQARATLDLARLDPDLSIQGVSVEEAEAALRHAWISLFITLALAGLFGALLGRALYKGIQAVRLPFLTKLSEADASLAAKIVEAAGGTKIADTVLRHFAGDALKAQEALAYVSNGEELTALIAKIKDADLTRRLLVNAGHGANLSPLLQDFKNYGQLEVLLGKASPVQLMALYDVAKSEATVAKILDAMDFATAQKLLQTGLSADESLALNSLGVDSVKSYFRLLAAGDEATREGILELLRLNKSHLPGGTGTYSNAVAAEALTKSAEFMTKYAGRASGDFVARFARIAETEQDLSKVTAKLAEAKTLGRNTTALEAQLAKAEAAAGRARSEVQAAEDIMEGRTALGKDLQVSALRERGGLGTPEFRVTGGGEPARLVEVKALGTEPGKPIGKNALANNFGQAAGQVADQALGGASRAVQGGSFPGTGERGALIRLDASRTGAFGETNEQLRSAIAGKWNSIVTAKPERAGTVHWVEIVDRDAAGALQRLLLEINENKVTIDTVRTTRIDPVKGP